MSETKQAAGGQRKWLSVLIIAAITAGITILFTIGSIATGGFASGEAMASREVTGFVGWPIAIHLATAIPAVLIGPVILWRRKGDAMHKMLGRIWVVLMLVTAIASAFIRTPGAGIMGSGFSLIHIFTLWTLVNVPLAIITIRKGNVKSHRSAMTGLYIGLCMAGLFTLLPGRLLGNWVFG